MILKTETATHDKDVNTSITKTWLLKNSQIGIIWPNWRETCQICAVRNIPKERVCVFFFSF